MSVGDLSRFFEVVLPHLDERQRRVVTGAAARVMGPGGITRVAEASGISRSTISKAAREVDHGIEPSKRSRQPGAGRKTLAEAQPGLVQALEQQIGPDSNESLLRWTTKSTSKLAVELGERGFVISPDSVARLLDSLGYRLGQAGGVGEHERLDRERQFRYIEEQARNHVSDGQPALSIDVAAKPVPPGGEERFTTSDFPNFSSAVTIVASLDAVVVSPDAGWLRMLDRGKAMAVAATAVRRWWEVAGFGGQSDVRRLLLITDDVSATSEWHTPWAAELGHLAADMRIDITMCHRPAGISRWTTTEEGFVRFGAHRRTDNGTVWHRTLIVAVTGRPRTPGISNGATFRVELGEEQVMGGKIRAGSIAVHYRPHEWKSPWNCSITPSPPDQL